MKDIKNPVAGYFEAQMAGTAGIVQAAVGGMQRVQEIVLRAMREGAGGQMALARSMTEGRDPTAMARTGQAGAGQAAEQFSRYQQELMSAVTDMNTEMIQASYSMMERVGNALAASSPSMGLPGAGQAGPMAAYEATVRQWQSAMQQMTGAAQNLVAGAMSSVEEAEEDEEEEEKAPKQRAESPRKSGGKRSGRR